MPLFWDQMDLVLLWVKWTDPWTALRANPAAFQCSDWLNERHETRYGRTPALLSSCRLWKWWVQKLPWINKNICMAALSCRMYNIIRRHLQITPYASAVWDMCVLKGLLFWALLQLHPVLCDEHELHAKPSLELHRLHKVTKIKARLAFNIPQNSVLNLHEIGLPYITAVWWNPLRLRGILISCWRRAHSSTFQGNLFSDWRGSFTLNGTSSHDQTM